MIKYKINVKYRYETFLEYGLKPFIELVNASCFKATVVILSQLIANFESSINMLTANQRCLKF